jgi:hypothetical protein
MLRYLPPWIKGSSLTGTNNRKTGQASGTESSFLVPRSSGGAGRLGLDRDIDFGTWLELYLLPIIVHQPIGNANFFVQIIGSLNGDLSLFWFSGPWLRMNHLLDSPWKLCSCLTFGL